MSNTLHRPQPLPPAHLRLGVLSLVLALHGGLLWVTNLDSPPHASMAGAMPKTVQSPNLQIFTRTGNRNSLASHSNFLAISNTGRQRFGRAEGMLALKNTQTVSSTLLQKNAVSTLPVSDADAPLKLSLAARYVYRAPVVSPGRSFTDLTNDPLRRKHGEAFAANFKTAGNMDCLKKIIEGPVQRLGALGPLLQQNTENKCRK